MVHPHILQKKRRQKLAQESDIITAYAWSRSFWGSDVVGGDWTEHEGSGENLAASGTNATTGVATTGLEASALPAALINAGVTPGTEGYIGSITWDNPAFHVRMLYRGPAAGSSDHMWRYLLSGVNYCEMRLNTTESINATVRSTAEGVNGWTFTGVVAEGWNLIDVHVDGVQMYFRINGVEDNPSAFAGVVDFTNGLDSFGLMDHNGGGNPADGTYLFWGLREGGSISLEQHQADAQALGLYTP